MVTDRSPNPSAKSASPGGTTRHILAVHNESDRRPKPILRDELAVVAQINTYPHERVRTSCILVGATPRLKILYKSIVIRLSVPYPEGARHISPGQRPGCGIIRGLALKGRNISLCIQVLLTAIAKSLSLLCRTYSARMFFSQTQGVAGGRLCPGLICVAPSGLLISSLD
jgi:hypothetical protein